MRVKMTRFSEVNLAKARDAHERAVSEGQIKTSFDPGAVPLEQKRPFLSAPRFVAKGSRLMVPKKP